MKTLINMIFAIVILGITFGLIALTGNSYGRDGVIPKLLYLIGGIYCVVKWIPWNEKV